MNSHASRRPGKPAIPYNGRLAGHPGPAAPAWSSPSGQGWRAVACLVLGWIAVLLMLAAPAAASASAQARKLADDLRQSLVDGSNAAAPWMQVQASRRFAEVLVVADGADPTLRQLGSAIAAEGGRVTHRFLSVPAVLAWLPADRVHAIAARSDVHSVSPNRPARRTASELEEVTLAGVARGHAAAGVDGRGVGIAVLDTGIAGRHQNFREAKGMQSRVRAAVDARLRPIGPDGQAMAGAWAPEDMALPDPYGHGSHVASVAAGSDGGRQPDSTGIAPAARLVDVRVLDAAGRGRVSDVLAGIDWVIGNARAHGIRVVNLSVAADSTEQRRWFRVMAQQVPLASGAGALVVHTDETPATGLPSRHELAFERHPLPMIAYDLDSLEVLASNQSAWSSYGYAESEFNALRMDALWHPDERAEFAETIRRLRGGEQPRHQRWRHCRRDGSELHAEVFGRPVDGWPGRRARLMLVNDVTLEVRATRSVRESAERLREMADAINEVFWLADLGDGSLLYVSPAYGEIWGQPPDLLRDRPHSWLEAVLPEDRGRVLAARAAGTTARQEVEYRIRRPDGSVRWIHDRSFPVYEADGRVKRVAGLARDVTEQRQRDARLRLLEAAVARLNDIVLITEAEPFSEPGPRIVYVNDAFERRTGYTRDEAIGNSPRMLQGPATQRDELDRIRRALERWEPVRAELINYTKAGDPFWLELDIVPLADETGWFTHWVAVERDISDRKLHEQQVLQSQRLESLGLITGGVAHDFNNLLTVVIGNAEALTDLVPADGHGRRMVEMVLQAAQRGADLTQRLLAFARRQPLAPRTVSLGALLSGLAPLIRQAVGDKVTTSVETETAADEVLVDEAQLENALLNLAMNANDAMPQGGRLILRVHEARVGGARGVAPEGAAPGRYVCISVSDNGHGIPAQHLPRVFEPFFTTKRAQRGTGLGLATVYGFVRQSNGWVTVQSRVGEGTEVCMGFPPSIEAAEPAQPSDAEPDTRRPEGSVLVVDDDEVVRELLVAQLRALGHGVLEADGADQALELLRSQADIVLLLTDVIMPGGLDGAELAKAARQIRPDLPVIFITGYSGDALMRGGRLDPGATVLAKPFRRRELARILRETLCR